MQILWIPLAFVVGAALVYFLQTPRITIAQSDAKSDRAKLGESAAAQHALELEVTALQAKSIRTEELENQTRQDSAVILKLTEDCATAKASAEAAHKECADFKSEIARLNEQNLSDKGKIGRLEVDMATMASTISERELSLREERSQFTSTKEVFKSQFAELSADALAANRSAFLVTAKQELTLQNQEANSNLDARKTAIENLVKPIRESIDAVAQAARDMELSRQNAFGQINQRLGDTVLAATKVATEAGALKDALKRPNVRGTWGQVQLKNCVELAGMEQHCDFIEQATTFTSDDDQLRPDMEVRMPAARKILVDSKTPGEHFLAYINSSDDTARNNCLVKHGKSVRGHITDLFTKDYSQRIGWTPDFVVMFLPNESFLAMALEREPNLMEDALSKKILIATPGTLIGLLKVVLYGWNEQKLADNAQLISQEGKKLNDELNKFIVDFANLGRAIDNVNTTYGDSRRRVEHQIARTSLSLSLLGAKSKVVVKKRLAPAVANIFKGAGADENQIHEISVDEDVAIAASVEMPADGDDEIPF